MERSLAGITDVVAILKTTISATFSGEVGKKLGANPFSAVLLHGPPGCGKTTLGYVIAKETLGTGISFYSRCASDLISGGVASVKLLFCEAGSNTPSIIFIDDIDGFALEKGNQHRDIMEQFMSSIKRCQSSEMLVIGTTSKPAYLHPELRKYPFFLEEICIPVPDHNAREEILRSLHSDSTLDYAEIARFTNGFVAADLLSLAQKVAEKKGGGTSDYMEALKLCEPGLLFTKPQVALSDVGLGVDLLASLTPLIRRLKSPELFKRVGIANVVVLLYGPPGCGKSLLAKALANVSGANFMEAKGQELRMYGDTEKNIRELFKRASMCSPCVLFIDEVESLTDQSLWVAELLNDLTQGNTDVIVIAATTRPNKMAEHAVRKDRFQNCFYVPLPGPEERCSILKALVKDVQVEQSVDLNVIATSCEDLTGADLKNLVEQALLAASNSEINMTHFQQVLANVQPSLTKEQIMEYKEIYAMFQGPAK